MRFFGGISNAESGLAGVSVRPAFPWVPTVSQVSVPPRGAVTRLGGEGDAVATPHAQSGWGGGLQDYSSQRNVRVAAGASHWRHLET